MVEASRYSQPGSSRVATFLAVWLGGLGLAGCSVVPKSRLDECHRLSQTLQAENNRLRDTTISLRSQNQDLNQRAVEDARRLRTQDEEIERLVQSVSAYQEDRDQLAAAFERIKSQVRSGAGSGSSGLPARLEAIARAHPAWEFDPQRGILTIPSSQLFDAGSDRLRDEAVAWLQETAAVWTTPEARELDLLVIGRNETSAVRRTALTAPEPASQPRPLGLARAARVRDLFIQRGGIAAARIEAAGFEVPHVGPDGDPAADSPDRRIEIHRRPRTAAPEPQAPSPPPTSADRTDP
jgi:chemotaxis protein MotB